MPIWNKMQAGRNTLNDCKMKDIIVQSVKISCLLLLTAVMACEDTNKMAPCESDFFYDGSPFRQGEAEVLLPSYRSGQDIPGVFSELGRASCRERGELRAV